MQKRNHFRLILTGAILTLLAPSSVHSQQPATAPVGFNSGTRAPTAADTTFRADADADGWDDLWLNLYDRGAELRGNPNGDFDGDGVSNVQEMRDFTNPLRKDRAPGVSPSASSAADRRGAAIAATKVEPLRDSAGRPTRLADLNREVEKSSHALAASLARTQADERSKAIAKAGAAGLETEGHFDDGSFFSIAGYEGGLPRTVGNQGLAEAVTIGTDQLWPNGALGYSLTGSGRTIGLWDGGIPLTTHQEFNDLTGTGASRITIGDGSTTVALHPTATAGVLAATGFNANAIGMAYEASITANDSNFDLAEMAALPLAAQRLNNHSYGFRNGWSDVSFTGIAVPIRAWFGDIGIATAESHLFGRYEATSVQTDQVVYNSPYALPVWSAGNDRLEPPATANKTVRINSVNGYYFTARNGVSGFFNGTRFWPGNGTISYNPGTGIVTFTPNAGVVSVLQTATIGNDGGTTGYDTIPGGYGTAKNVLAVGAVDQAGTTLWTSSSGGSSSGPADDGRLKPEVVAVGVSVFLPLTGSNSTYGTGTGTSFAAPGVAGSLNLLAQHQENLWTSKEPFLASTLRALAAHTATDLGATGPDYQTGYGRMDTSAAATLIESNFVSGARSYIKEVVVPNNGIVEFPVKGVGGIPIRVTAAWTDPAGTAQTATLDPSNSVLVNNLDLRVYRQVTSGTPPEFRPWTLNPASPATAAVKTATNDRDNLEQVVTVNAVANALYTVRVIQKAGTTLTNGSQRLSIVVSNISPLPKPYFQITNLSISVTGGALRGIVTWNSVVGQWYRLQKSSTPGGPWVDDSGDFNAIQESTTATSNPTTPIPSTQFWRVIEVPPNPFGLP